MIPARKHRLFARWFSRQVERQIRRNFSALHVRRLEGLTGALSEGPVLAFSNHSSYWDSMLVILIGHRLLTADGYAMMDAANLQQLPFLGRVGGFGVDLESPMDGVRGIRYATALLDRPGRLVWVFPQGKECPRALPIDNFKPGAAIICKNTSRCALIPVAFQYELRGGEKPEAFVAIGKPLSVNGDTEACRLAQEAAIRKELKRIDEHLCLPENGDGFELIFNHRPGKNQAWPVRALSRLTRY